MTHPRADVLIPIYRSPDLAESCLRSIVEHTPVTTRLIIIDDASRDAGVDALLASTWVQELAANGRAIVTRNSTNEGFGATCNKAAEIAGDRDLIIINSDVLVGAGWYERMTTAATHAPRLGTLSTLTNNGTMLSVPTRNAPRPTFPTGISLAAVMGPGKARDTVPVQISNAVGHVMYVSREAITKVGLFDPAYYPGYGEEVDFCLRASEAGFRHYVTPDTIVFHRGSGSFGKERSELVARHSRVVQARYPYVWKLASESESNAYVGLERIVSATAPRMRPISYTSMLGGHIPGATQRPVPKEASVREVPPEEAPAADCVVVHVTNELPAWLPIDEQKRLIVVFERTDLIAAPWLHRTAATWKSWLARVRSLCAVADIIVTREPQTLQDWGLGAAERVTQLAPRRRPLATPLDGAEAGTLLVGPASSAEFVDAARRLILAEPEGSPHVVGEPIPCTWSDPPAERAIRDGLAMSTIVGYRGRTAFPDLWVAAGCPRRILCWGPIADDVAWATAGQFGVDGSISPNGWSSMSLREQMGHEDDVHAGSQALTVEGAVLHAMSLPRNVARQLLVHTEDRSMACIDAPSAFGPEVASTPLGRPRTRIRSLVDSLRYEGVAATRAKLGRLRSPEDSATLM